METIGRVLGLVELQAEPRANDAKNRKVHDASRRFEDSTSGSALALMDESLFLSQDGTYFFVGSLMIPDQ